MKKILALVLTFGLLAHTAEAATKSRHSETFLYKNGMVQFFLIPTYPLTLDNLSFMSKVYNIKDLKATTYMRNLTPEEYELVIQGTNPYMSVFEDIPESIGKNGKAWQEKYSKEILPFNNSNYADETFVKKYNIQQDEYPLFIYFAPSGNMYKFPIPAWRGEPSHAEFWQILEKEVRYKQGRGARLGGADWNETKDDKDLTEEELNKKRMFTIK